MSAIFETTILGSSAAIPTSLRHTSAQLLKYHNLYFLIDCAEGCQMQLRRLKKPLMKISHIFISHLHGDHYLGLPGLLFSLHLLGREKEMHVYSPPGLEEMINLQYKIAGLTPSFQIRYHDLLEGETRVYEDDFLTVETIAMEHRLPTFGFLFREKPKERTIRKESLSKYRIPVARRGGIKKGEDLITEDGTRIPNEEITLPPPPPRSYAFCSDTAYTESFIEQVRHADLLYHEATFMHDKAGIARQKLHSTTIEAATLAKKAEAGTLMIGHYSARYKELEDFLREASTVFPETILAREGETVTVKRSEAHSTTGNKDTTRA